MPSRILLLTGPSSSGKSTLATHLQSLFAAEPFLLISLDAFRAMEPPNYWSAETKPLWPHRIEALCRAINATAASYARSGQSVIVDHVVPPEAWPWIEQDWAGLHFHVIGIHCDAAELSRREQARGDRPAGLALSQASTIHQSRVYDFNVDTTSTAPDACARLLHDWLSR